MSPQYHSASCSECAGGERQLLFMVEDTGFVDRGGRAASKREWEIRKWNANDRCDSFLERDPSKLAKHRSVVRSSEVLQTWLLQYYDYCNWGCVYVCVKEIQCSQCISPPPPTHTHTLAWWRQDLRTSPGMFPRDITLQIITQILSAVSTKKGNVAVGPHLWALSVNSYEACFLLLFQKCS